MAGEQHTADKTTQPPMGDALAGLSDAQLDQFMLDGNLPDTTQADTPAEAAAAQPVEQAASTDALSKAVTEPAAPEKGKRPGHKKNASERAAEIEREASEAEERLAKALERRARAREAEREATREEPRPLKVENVAEAAAAGTKEAREAARKRFASMPDAPKADDYEGPDALVNWATDLNIFIGEKIAEEKFGTLYDQRSAAQREESARIEAFEQSAQEGFGRAAKEIEQLGEEVLDRIDPKMMALKPLHDLGPNERPTVAHFVKDQCLLKAKNPLQLLAWVTANDNAELKRIGRLDPESIIRELAYQDAAFSAPSADPDQDTAGTRRHSRVSNAAAPSPTLGKRAAGAKDPRKAPDSYEDFDSWNVEESKAGAGARG